MGSRPQKPALRGGGLRRTPWVRGGRAAPRPPSPRPRGGAGSRPSARAPGPGPTPSPALLVRPQGAEASSQSGDDERNFVERFLKEQFASRCYETVTLIFDAKKANKSRHNWAFGKDRDSQLGFSCLRYFTTIWFSCFSDAECFV